ncbi:MAG TPA: BNR-4 repeat-containing protein [Phycisphaerae bacterium]|nr:BNR-4 repeat-containing protein [Phycisphaerae bacterium]
MCNLPLLRRNVQPVLACVLSVCVWTTASRAVDPNTRLDGYRGIWFNLGQTNEYGPKYSGGLGTYTANHVPICIYAEAVNKTFFSYGGVDDATGDLLIMVSYYDHATCLVPRPTVVHHKMGVNDPHDNAAILLDRDGYIWVFISGRGRARTGWLYRSTAPYSIDSFEWIHGGDGENFFEKTYPQPWYLDNGVDQPIFLYLFTKYTAGRELYWSTSTDGINWAPDRKLVGFAGHYQTSCRWKHRIGTAFNYHPGGNVDRRTNLYYLQTDDVGNTWTTVDGTPVTTPLSSPQNPALVVDYESQGLLCYINDTNFDAQGRPYICYETSRNYAAGPDGDPRVWHLARWDGQQWIITDITVSDHNYDVGNLWVEGDHLRIIGPTENGPQLWGAGGEVALWTSSDLGATWTKQRDVTSNSMFNHSYVRRVVNGRDPFYAMWADGHSFTRSDSSLYFCNRAGTHVWRLPRTMYSDFARPIRVTDFGNLPGPPLWRSRFETTGTGSIEHGQTLTFVRNSAGAPGHSAGPAPLTYVAYGQPGVGSAPSAGAGDYAASLPDDRAIGINTGLPSNAGNLQNAVTIEGFFRTPDGAAATTPTYVARRLVTLKRSDNDGESRLAVGLHGGGTLPGTGGLYDYDGFDYAGPSLHGQAGGTGWGAAWVNSSANYQVVSGSLSLPGGPPATGARLVATGGTAARALSHFVNLGADGNTLYFSAYLRKSSNVSGSNVEINLTPASTGTQTTRFGMTSDGQFFLNNSANKAGTVEPNTTYFVIGKIVSHAGTNDQVYMTAYGPGSTVPATEPADWLLTDQINSSVVLQNLRLVVGANTVGEFDEIRTANTYAGVTDPNAPIASGGGAANVLSVFWHDTDGVNHLELGATPILPDTWYHFAAVYNGTDIKWYLNGNLEGEVAAPNLVSPGSAWIAIGNNRLSGVEDRGFYGLLDNVRISDQALVPASFLSHGGSCDADCGTPNGGVLWCSGFEASPNAPVAHQQLDTGLCASIENLHGASGTAKGTSSLSYVQYGQPGVGDAITPEAGAFALALPDDRSVAVETSILSNAGDLNQGLTFEGFFNTAETALIVSPDSVGRRLVTQKRDLMTDTRLAIGLHAQGGANVLSVVYKNSSGATYTAFGTTPVQPNRWYHFALTCNAEAMRWYLDGHLEGELLSPDLIDAGNAPITIGNRRGDGVADRGFFGMLDEIRIHDRVLSPAEFLIGDPSLTGEPCLPGCPRPFADADGDGDVDQADFGFFQACFTTSGELLPLPGCHCFDRAGDEAIDATDLEEFINCATGPAVIWEPALTPACIP